MSPVTTERIRRDHPFTIALKAALAQAGLTQVTACARAGISTTTLAMWLRGDGRPSVEALDRLIAVLDAPALATTIDTHRRVWYSLTCTDCGNTRKYQLNNIEERIERSQREKAKCGVSLGDLDPGTGQGTHRCGGCMTRRKIAADIKRGGRKLAFKFAFYERDPQALERMQKASAAARQGRPLPASTKAAMSIGHIRSRPKGRFSWCRVPNGDHHACGGLVHKYTGSMKRGTGDNHGSCYQRWCSEKGILVGRAIPSRGTGRRLSSEEIADSFDMAVSHLVRTSRVDPRTGRRAKGRESIPELAERFGVTASAVLKRIRELVARLPDDNIEVSPYFRGWCNILRAAAKTTPSF